MPITRIKLADRIERQVEQRGVEIELSDGTVLYVDPPELWSTQIREAAKDKKLTREGFAKVLVGDEDWDKFVEDGGTVDLFDMIVRERWDASTGESSGSSTS